MQTDPQGTDGSAPNLFGQALAHAAAQQASATTENTPPTLTGIAHGRSWHPTRGAPLCRQCAHFSAIGRADELTCGHPTTPVCPVDGSNTLSTWAARAADGPCGPAGLLWEPMVAITQQASL